eukprot:423820-Prorocentrum_minimum.AAC.1
MVYPPRGASLLPRAAVPNSPRLFCLAAGHGGSGAAPHKHLHQELRLLLAPTARPAAQRPPGASRGGHAARGLPGALHRRLRRAGGGLRRGAAHQPPRQAGLKTEMFSSDYYQDY